MRRRLPPFPAVRAFEASARHLSFKKAASELCLTQSAISHQIKALEDYLGVGCSIVRPMPLPSRARGSVTSRESALFSILWLPKRRASAVVTQAAHFQCEQLLVSYAG
ncbi:LysR family transcriptional regulator [Nordella sp. HKS 07]|uniref:LysR family transcriptional regulator n=1 Tax=Nordella sp. HKS 07 TaxID=2712222 RepID=UPI0013E171A6|nr:LysR family transcriptional regulator [Nordella sp. HKS 07]